MSLHTYRVAYTITVSAPDATGARTGAQTLADVGLDAIEAHAVAGDVELGEAAVTLVTAASADEPGGSAER